MKDKDNFDELAMVMNWGRRPPSYFPIMRQFLRTLPGVVMFSFLFDEWQRAWSLDTTKNDGFIFWCTITDKQIARATGLTPDEIAYGKKNIKELDFVIVERRGSPPKTRYALKWLGFQVALHREFPLNGSYKKGGDEARNDKKDPFGGVRELTIAAQARMHAHPSGTSPSGVGLPTPQNKDHPRWKKYANQLADAIKQVRKLTKLSIKNWSYSIYMLHKGEGIPIPRLKSVLDWYTKELITNGDLNRSNPKYLSIAYSGQTFRQKFLKLEGQMERYSEEDGKDQPQTKIKKTIVKYTKEERQKLRKAMGL